VDYGFVKISKFQIFRILKMYKNVLNFGFYYSLG